LRGYDISVKRKLKTVKFENGTYTMATEFRKIFIEENNNYLYLVKWVLFKNLVKATGGIRDLTTTKVSF
jgi:hypothetical protein